MKNIFKLFPIGIIIFLMLNSCKTDIKSESNVEVGDEAKVELCVNYYLTEEEGAKRLQQLAANYNSADDWKSRAKAIKENIYSGAGLDKISKEDWNYPIKVTKSNKHEMDGYSVENVALEVKPGYFVTGNLYQPLELAELNPAVLSPHGH